MKKKHFFYISILLLITVSQSCALRKNITLGDPSIFFDDDTYYLYGTGAKKGFKVYTSKDKKHWSQPLGSQNGYALRMEDVYGDRGFWAPQIFQFKGNYYMAYTANQHLAIAKSNSPLGPFVQEEKKPLQSNFRQIDPYVFIDEDKIYLYYVKVADGANRIYVTELNEDFSIKPGTAKKCIEATEKWENVDNDKWSVTEGPTVLKYGSKYYLIYSANHFKSQYYSVGYAIADHPVGPWTKAPDNPILNKELIKMNGSGHGDIFKDNEGWYYVFHTHFSNNKVNPRKTAIIEAVWKQKKNGINKLSMERGSHNFLKMKKN